MVSDNNELNELMLERTQMRKKYGCKSIHYNQVNKKISRMRKKLGIEATSDESDLHDLLLLRDQIKGRQGIRSRRYLQVNKKISRLKEKLSTKLTHKDVSIRDFCVHKDSLKNLIVEPKEHTEVSLSTFGGYPIRHLDVHPTIEDARKIHGDISPRFSNIVEGGILKLVCYSLSDGIHERKLTTEDKNEIVHIIGWAFGRDEFDYSAAKVAFNLLFNSQGKKTGAMKIIYTYNDPITGLKMTALVGAIIFDYGMSLVRHEQGKDDVTICPTRWCRVYNMVQLGVLKEYSQRNIGGLTMQTVEHILKSMYNVDFLWWCGCAWKFYDHCGYKKDPVMINVPFKIDPDEKGNRSLFYYVDLAEGSPGTSKFQKYVMGPYTKNSDLYFSVAFKNNHLMSYYGIPQEREQIRKFKHIEVETIPSGVTKRIYRETYQHKVVEMGNTTSITMKVSELYSDEDMGAQVVTDGSIQIFGVRKDRMGNIHHFFKVVTMHTKIEPQSFHFTVNEGQITISHNLPSQE